MIKIENTPLVGCNKKARRGQSNSNSRNMIIKISQRTTYKCNIFLTVQVSKYDRFINVFFQNKSGYRIRLTIKNKYRRLIVFVSWLYVEQIFLSSHDYCPNNIKILLRRSIRTHRSFTRVSYFNPEPSTRVLRPLIDFLISEFISR